MVKKNKILESKIKKAKDIARRIYILYDSNEKIGNWELDIATDAIYKYIKELDAYYASKEGGANE